MNIPSHYSFFKNIFNQNNFDNLILHLINIFEKYIINKVKNKHYIEDYKISEDTPIHNLLKFGINCINENRTPESYAILFDFIIYNSINSKKLNDKQIMEMVIIKTAIPIIAQYDIYKFDDVIVHNFGSPKVREAMSKKILIHDKNIKNFLEDKYAKNIGHGFGYD